MPTATARSAPRSSDWHRATCCWSSPASACSRSARQHVAARLLRDPDVSGTHENAPDGFLLAFGTTVAPGRKQRGSIVDVTPTILYFLGLPIGRDMDGFARADLFNEPFTAERPDHLHPVTRRLSRREVAGDLGASHLVPIRYTERG